MTKMTWDNPALVGPKMAERVGLKSGDMVELAVNGNKITAPIWIQAGHPDNSVTVFLGYGRRRAGRVGTGAGFDVYPLRSAAAPWFTTGATLKKVDGVYLLATTQGYQTMEHRGWRQPSVGADPQSRRISQRTGLRAGRQASRGTNALPGLRRAVQTGSIRLGHDDRFGCVRWLQQLHHRLPI